MNATTPEILDRMAHEVEQEMICNILPFWLDRMTDTAQGGFYGRIDGLGTLHAEAARSAVLNMRILWSFSAAYRVTGDQRYLTAATRAKVYIDRHFIDPDYGGVYWSVNAEGKPLDTKKQIYALGFAIYGMSEYYRATGDTSALHTAQALFEAIETHAYDPLGEGYFEAFGRDWQEIDDMRLSDKDANERKTMNTHLHILEPYTNLYRVWPSPRLKASIHRLIILFCDRIVDPVTAHFNLFFGDQWDVRSHIISYGHDIEGSWLLHEAALMLGDPTLLGKVEPIVRQIAYAAAEGVQPDGSICYETDLETGHSDLERHWWPQAESVIGYLNLYQHFADKQALDRSIAAWNYIREQLIDPKEGEWYWSRKADGTPNLADDKAGFWKCPYHNSRMCLEVIERVKTQHIL
ncbi:MAG: AGE family epimerase/isomerase [Alistipes sp.]